MYNFVFLISFNIFYKIYIIKELYTYIRIDIK